MKKILPRTAKNPSGFTLVELLVVVAIIAILAIIGAVIFSGVQAKARDAKRQAEIIAIAKAFEANKTSGSTSYPAITTAWFAGGVIPSDTYTGATPPVYSIAYVDTTSCVVGRATTASWDSSSSNPASSTFTLTPPTGCGTLVIGAVSTAPANITSFQICALLESGTTNIFCVPNVQ